MGSSEAPNQGSSQPRGHSGASPRDTAGTAQEIPMEDHRRVEKNSTIAAHDAIVSTSAETNIEKKTETSHEPTENPDHDSTE